MEEATADSLGASLLQWVRSFGREDGWEDLSSGQALWSILQEVDPEYFTSHLPEPTLDATGDWTRKWQNLKHIEKQVSLYYRDVCNAQEDLNINTTLDLKAVAAESSVRDLEMLILVIIRAAMASTESNQRMAQRLMSLGRENAMVIANGLRNMEEVDYTELDPESRDESAYQSEQETAEKPKANGWRGKQDMYSDVQLEREEELLQAQATIDKLQASHVAAQRQLDDLRHDKEMLQEAFDTYRAEINHQGRKPGADDGFKKLERQVDNDRAHIEDLENQLQSSRSATEMYERQLERHKAENEATQNLRDDLQALKAENEDLVHKIKANENLKKKIHTLQEHERVNTQLRDQLKQANDQLQGIEGLKTIQAELEKEIIEKKGLIRNQEYQITELTTTRKHAEYDAKVLAKKLEAARERHDRDHEAIEDLQSQLQNAHLRGTQMDETPQEENRQLGGHEPKHAALTSSVDDSRHLAEKLAMVEQQLEAADARLKQASKRNAQLEENERDNEEAHTAQEAAAKKISEHENTIAELRGQMESSKLLKAAAPQDLAALQHENRLMSTAWHDLASRLQNSDVSLGRRRREPKSWIGKQRALVGPDIGQPGR